ncbi:hypothetical protein PR202_ga06928 [Eleusine coracana subsp. coracana]|uniref:cytokinin dehydrogenase n=1 Tax=Eleusine coracana subsp. coracana TaxID=191504 RepID=A0AAV5BW76_ELECO|nr:hypothetical protein PR202_ga06928 [Eleusine coracana subsp. coracana]
MAVIRALALAILSSFFSVAAGQLRPLPAAAAHGGLPVDLFSLSIASKLRTDHNSTAKASTDFGQMVKAAPAAVLHPSTPADIAALIRSSAASPAPFPAAPRGQGHSWRGQALAAGGVVVDMRALGRRARINVSAAAGEEPYVDAGGEQLWIDVLHAALKHGLAPRAWTDYLRLTVGGTLSNAGIGGQAFRYGPQIANVHELDVVTGTGEMVTCSRDKNADLFFAALGGLGQFGVITRARIRLERAPKRVRWVRLAYSDVVSFTKDQELLISNRASEAGFDYVEGQVQLNRSFAEGPKSTPFFSGGDMTRLAGFASRTGASAIYYIEAAIKWMYCWSLSFEPGFVFTKDVTYVQFLDRVRQEEQVLRDANPAGIILMYPMNKDRWDDRMTAVTAGGEDDDDGVFYAVGMLWSALSAGDVERLERQNEAVLGFCDEADIGCKQYLPHFTSQDGWRGHFGAKWERLVELKAKYDPHAILSPGQRIFASRAEKAGIASS